MGQVFNIMRYSVHDGPGIRTTVFLKGCPLRCAWCHNPESQAFHPEQMTFDERCRRCGACVPVCPRHGIGNPADGCRIPAECDACGQCAETCVAGAREIVGREISVAEVLATVERDRVFFDESGGGVTISGGEPLAQADFTEHLLRGCRDRDLHTVLDTCGYAPPDVFARVSVLADIVLFDIKVMDSEQHAYYTGVSNTLIHANLRWLAATGCEVTVRFPLVPGVNDSPRELDALIRLLDECRLPSLHVLPYHAIGNGKRRRLGENPPPDGFAAPPCEQLEAVAAVLRGAGLNVHVGGSL